MNLMSEQGISVRIGGKSYPMTVESPEEEETIRKAERLIRSRMTLYETNYTITDMKDLLGMCLLQFATEAIEKTEQADKGDFQVTERLKALDGKLDEALA